MKKPPWWQADDMGHSERVAFHDTADNISYMQDGAIPSAGQIQQLVRLDRFQAEEIETLRATVRVLIQLLADTGVLESKLLEYRLEAAIEEAKAISREALTRRSRAVCARCGAKIPDDQTRVSASRSICNACHQ